MRRSYPDLRYKYVRGLIRHERDQRRHHFLKQAAEWTSKAIVSLSLADVPIRSVKQAQKLEGVGGVICRKLKEIDDNESISADAPRNGRYISSAAALMVAMLNAGEDLQRQMGKENVLVPEDVLREFAAPICEEYFINNNDRDEPVFCIAWWRLTVLISRGYIKKRSKNKKPVYELLDDGFEVAHQLRGTTPVSDKARFPELIDDVESKPGTSLNSSYSQSTSPNQTTAAKLSSDALYSNDDGSDGLILLIDIHEQGGDRCKLGELSQSLTEIGVRHKTRHLSCGDYCWMWRCHGEERILPVLVERKRADDLAWSLKDGRYFRQKQQMLEWKNTYPSQGVSVTLQYIIESKPESYRVKCGDDCQGVAKCGNPSVDQVNNVISELESSADFDVIRTPNIEGTIDFLTSVTLELKQRLDAGDFDSLALSDQVPTSTEFCQQAPVASCQICCSKKSKHRKNEFAENDSKKQRKTSTKQAGKQDFSIDDIAEMVGKDTPGDFVAVGIPKCKVRKMEESLSVERAATTERYKYNSSERQRGRIVAIGGNTVSDYNADMQSSHIHGYKKPSETVRSGWHHHDQNKGRESKYGQISTIGGSLGPDINRNAATVKDRYHNAGLAATTSNFMQSNLRDIQILSSDHASSDEELQTTTAKSSRPSLSSIGGVFGSDISKVSKGTPKLSEIGNAFKSENTDTVIVGQDKDDRYAVRSVGCNPTPSRTWQRETPTGNLKVNSASNEIIYKDKLYSRESEMSCSADARPETSTAVSRDRGKTTNARPETSTAVSRDRGKTTNARPETSTAVSRDKWKTTNDRAEWDGRELTDKRQHRQKTTQTKGSRSIGGSSGQKNTNIGRRRHTYTLLPSFDSDSDETDTSCYTYLSSAICAKNNDTAKTMKTSTAVASCSSCKNERNPRSSNTQSGFGLDFYESDMSSEEELFDPFASTPQSDIKNSSSTRMTGNTERKQHFSSNLRATKARNSIDDDDDIKNEIETVLSILPHISHCKAKQALEMSNGSVEAAIDRLLNDTSNSIPANLSANQHDGRNNELIETADLDGIIDLTDSQ